MKKTLLIALLLPITLYTLSAQNFVNGSFEDADYSGWTLIQNNSQPNAGIFGLEDSGVGIIDGNSYTNYADNLLVAYNEGCADIPAFTATGTLYGFTATNNPVNQRMYQDIALSATAENLEFDLAYESFTAFDANDHFLAVHVRDAGTDAIIETLFKTTDGIDPTTQTLDAFSFDISDYAGTTVRIDFEFQITLGCFSIQYDNFNITDSSLSNDDFLVAGFSIYPNPTSDFISVSGLTGKKISSAAIYDTLGKAVFKLDEESLNSNGMSSISNLNAGIYFLKLQFAERGSLVKKLVIR